MLSPQHHHHDSAISSGRLLITLLLNLTICAVEIIGGVWSGSLSLISDALHNFGDGISIVISWIALRLSNHPRTIRYTFGMKRAQILAAVLNAATLIAISLFLFREAWQRFQSPEVIRGGLMVTVAGVGLAANVIGTLLLRSGAKQNMNLRSSYLHLLSDAVSSVGVIIGGLAIMWWHVTWIDPLLTVLISAYILRESIEIVRESTGILMMKTPDTVNLNKICDFVASFPGVRNLHHVHSWQLDEHHVHFEGHAEVDDMPLSKASVLLDRIESALFEQFGIRHVTIQLETGRCEGHGIIANEPAASGSAHEEHR